MSVLVQLFLPLYSNHGERFPATFIQQVRRELTDVFGGVTAYTRAPAEGWWEDEEGRTRRDDVVTIEIMADSLDEAWWRNYARSLAERFQQEEVMVRAIAITDLSSSHDGHR